VKRLIADFPRDPIGLAGGNDLGHAAIGRPFRIHARHVVGAGNGLIGASIRQSGRRHRDERKDHLHQVSQGTGFSHFQHAFSDI
jgi:hypothetical protein